MNKILEAILLNPDIKKTPLMYKANLNYDRLVETLETMYNNGLIVGTQKIIVTQRGLNYMRIFAIVDFLANENMHLVNLDLELKEGCNDEHAIRSDIEGNAAKTG